MTAHGSGPRRSSVSVRRVMRDSVSVRANDRPRTAGPRCAAVPHNEKRPGPVGFRAFVLLTVGG